MLDGGDSELRQQLREAWRQIADLQWQLQAEQQHNRRHERLRAAQDDDLSDALQRHEQALAERDQEIADLEDTHTGLATAWQNERREIQRKSARELVAAREEHEGSDRYDARCLRLAVDLLSAYVDATSTHGSRSELEQWARHCGVMLAIIETLDGAGAASVEAALMQVVEGHPGVSVDVQLRNVPVNREQVILCGLLLYNHLSRTPEHANTFLSGGRAQVSVVEDTSGLPQVWMTLPNRGATVADEAADAIWHSILVRLRGRVDYGSGDTGPLVNFPAL